MVEAAGAAIAAQLGITSAAGIFATQVATGVVIAASVSVASAAASKALQKKPKTPNFGLESRDRTVSLRQPVEPWRIVCGELRLGGTHTMVHTTDKPDLGAGLPVEGNGLLHLVTTLASHEVAAIGQPYFDGSPIILDASGDPTSESSLYQDASGNPDFFVMDKNLGTDAQAVIAKTQDAQFGMSALWTTNHRQRGHAGAYTRFRWNADRFPGGLPNLTWDVRGKNDIYDPRTAGTGYTNNPALFLNNYICDTRRGLGAVYASEIDEDALIAAANVCDEMVATADDSETFTADASTDRLTLTSVKPKWRRGDKVRVETTGVAPGGLAVLTDYYAIPVSGYQGRFKLATSLANARADSAINITDAGSGVHTLRRLAEPRYTMDGSFSLDQSPRRIIEGMLSAMHGKAVYVGGKWYIYAGAYRTPTITLDEDDLRGAIRGQTLLGRNELFNTVKGIYASPSNSWQLSDFPSVTNATYVAQDDGETIPRDLELLFTASPSMAQRIAKIALEANRQQLTYVLPCKFSAYRLVAGDTVMITNTRRGWSSKVFEVVSSTLVREQTEGGIAPGVDLVVRETAAAVYDWGSGEETTVDPAPNTNLPNPFTVAEPGGPYLASGTTHLYLREDGTVFSRIHVSWDLNEEAYVLSGGEVEIQYKRSADSTWEKGPRVPGSDTFAYLLDVEDGVSYDVRVRAINSIGVMSAWATTVNHTVVGKTAAPSNVASLTAQRNGVFTTFKWTQIADKDLAGYELRYMEQGAFVWADAQVITSVTRGTVITNGVLPPGDWTIGIKARDTSGNYSATAATFDISVSNTYNIIFSAPQHPRWPGARVDLVKHDVSNRLVPSSQSLASAADWEIFDQFVYNPVASGTYEAAEMDVGFDTTGLRVWAEMAAVMGPGETTGVADPGLEIDYKLAAGAYDGFEPWTVGEVNARYVKARAKVDTSVGLFSLSGFEPVVDVPERTEHGEDVVIAPGGSSVTFSEAFHTAPNVQVTPDGASALFPVKSNVTTTGFDVNVYDAGGTDVGGTVDWSAVGG